VLLENNVTEPKRTSRFQTALRGLTITHYHDLAHRMWAALDEDTDEVELTEIPARLIENANVLRALIKADDSWLPKVDTLLVDEGQDWGPKWLKSLQPLLRDGASITVAADPAQRIYDHAVLDPATLFSESPATTELNGTARMPAALLPAHNVAVDRWLSGRSSTTELKKAPQLAMDFADRPNPKAVWTTVHGPDQHRASHGKLRRCLVAAVRNRTLQGVNPSQIAVLVPTHDDGLRLEDQFETADISLCSLCVEDPDHDRGPKHAFWRLDPRLKLSTVHSFKGWEADVVLVLLPQLPPSQTACETLHVALSRTRAVIEVVAPSGGEDLPAWTHRTGATLLESIPQPDVDRTLVST
jgi:superfamily I DNA/RNA helicase